MPTVRGNWGNFIADLREPFPWHRPFWFQLIMVLTFLWQSAAVQLLNKYCFGLLSRTWGNMLRQGINGSIIALVGICLPVATGIEDDFFFGLI